MLTMFYYTVFGKGLDDLGNLFPSVEVALYWVISDHLLNGELMDLLDYQYVKTDFVNKAPPELGSDSPPLDLYCSYSMDQNIGTSCIQWGKGSRFKGGF
ncbi:hypothetical protein [Desulfosporosinus fructosivorans]|uniref:hypothetical protein n=1 Tax=Desulfosporosinus fructosivorans TaxID=2018669 RepID=UPI001A7E8504|nr:hypothetical protein [Desulfosporosinus fructosivorans]